MVDPQMAAVVVSVVLPGVGAVMWLARLESRVTNQEQLSKVHEERAGERHSETIERFNRLEDRLDRALLSK